MKKIMLTCLIAIPFCQAADPDANGNAATRDIDWQAAESLFLADKQLTALPSDFNPPQLEMLNLDNNQLTALPAAFNPPRLKWLLLDNNQLNALPDNFNPLQLETISLSNNQLAALPDAFNPHQLKVLHLDGNEINDEEINRMIGRFEDPNDNYLPQLQILTLSKNPITQDAVDRLRQAVAGRNITIYADNITGDILSNIKG